jgi:hypothetical protein
LVLGEERTVPHNTDEVNSLWKYTLNLRMIRKSLFICEYNKASVDLEGKAHVVISEEAKLGCACLSAHSRWDASAAHVGLPYVLFNIVRSQTCVQVMSEWWSTCMQVLMSQAVATLCTTDSLPLSARLTHFLSPAAILPF